MFGFFRNKHKLKIPLQNWEIPVDGRYRKIINEDSVQFVNADESVCLYFSVLMVSGNSAFSETLLSKKDPAVARVTNGWELKAAKPGGSELLVCVFSFAEEADEAMMRELYANIVYTGQ